MVPLGLEAHLQVYVQSSLNHFKPCSCSHQTYIWGHISLKKTSITILFYFEVFNKHVQSFFYNLLLLIVYLVVYTNFKIQAL